MATETVEDRAVSNHRRPLWGHLWEFLGRWYVSLVLAVALGVLAGYLVFFHVFPGRPQVGVIDIPHTVLDDESAFVISKMLDYVRDTDSIKAVVIRLVSPGGDSASSEELFLKTLHLRQKKPVVVASGWINASGGIHMSLGANYIYAQPASFVGSIGVVLGLREPDPPDELEISTGPAKNTGAAARTFTGMMEMLKDSFIQTVIDQRGDRLKLSKVDLAEARLYTGLEAAQVGLIDAIGTDVDAIEKAAELAGISSYGVIDVNSRVLENLVDQERRLVGESYADGPSLQLWDAGRGRTRSGSATGGANPDLPVELNLPRMYYLYVTPSE